MNAAAALATGEYLLFVHADSRLPADAAQVLEPWFAHGATWGRFDVRLSGSHPLLRIVERLMNWRSRWSGVATGDQALFAQREAFDSLGGFPDISLMEDIALSKRLRRRSRPVCLRQRVITSSRRWERNGIWRTIRLMWWLRLRYFLGADPDRLARIYYHND